MSEGYVHELQISIKVFLSFFFPVYCNLIYDFLKNTDFLSSIERIIFTLHSTVLVYKYLACTPLVLLFTWTDWPVFSNLLMELFDDTLCQFIVI